MSGPVCRARAVPLALAFVLAMTGAASGGAWTRPPGEGGVYVTFSYSQAEQAYGPDYLLDQAADFTALEGRVYLEFGLLEGLTLIGLGGYQMVEDAPLGRPVSEDGLQPTGGGLRLRLLTLDEAVVSVEGVVLGPGSAFGAPAPLYGGEGVDADLRALLGLSLDVFGFPAFTDVQIGYRARFGAEGDEIRADVTAGADLDPNWQVVVQSFTTASVAAGEGPYPALVQSNARVGVVYRLTPELAVEAGVFGTLAGRNVVAERGITLGLAWQFGS